ncbi:DUF5689 domain-containing protein [Lutibacter sp.]|uniref:DUF5689 domain-containing protein n=1 Tax=Lutibacter sp. TaxID=1925666 RepID=UPI0027343549|nr:DUF5689 domain-containing protein [Lutibacter sp.]MDP3312245.1 DUF5689 domain-containing protein [Lutibacter sp.]
MKLYKTIQISLLLSVFIGTNSCVKDSDFKTPEINCTESSLIKTNTFQQIKDMFTFGGAIIIKDDLVIEGYVVSNDEFGNFYKTISIQDKPENPTSAIKIAIDQTNLYTKYNVGRKVFIKLKGLAIGYGFGSIQVGKSSGRDVVGISAFEVDKHIFRSCEVAIIIPKKVAISDLNNTMLEMLIELENVQFKQTDMGSSYGNIENTASVNRMLESFNANCNLENQIILRNSGFANFKNQLLPAGKGAIVAVFSNFYNDYQLYIRNVNDVKFNKERCDYSNALKPTITLAELKNMYKGSMVEFAAGSNLIVEGYVNSTDEYGSFQEKIVIQNNVSNPTTGLQILVEKESIFKHFNLGDKVYIQLDKLYMNQQNGVLTLGFTNGTKITEIEEEIIGNFIYNSKQNFNLIPLPLQLSEVNSAVYKNLLLAVQNVQLIENEKGKAFAFYSGTSSAIRTLEKCNETSKLSVFTNGKALFANQSFPTGRGTITGVFGEYLELRNGNDVQFNLPSETCVAIVPKVMITEVADPKNNVSARFIEIYNAGETTINLNGWKLNKYINGSSTVSSGAVSLNGIVIAAKDFVIIAASEYKVLFNDIPDIESSYISGNGDDVYQLVDNTNKTIDIFGEIGVDGNGTNWEYLDGRAVRKTTITSPNPVFNSAEWIIYSDVANSLITFPNTPQNAPTNFNPRSR